MLKKLLGGFVAVCLMAYPGAVSAGETDLLIQKLVEKGILSASEAQILQDDVKQDVARQNAKGTNDMIPAWVQTTKIKGDLRLRYQTQQREAGTTRNRGRIRYRLGVETKPNDQLLVGAGLSSAEKQSSCTTLPCTNGVDDARSTNSTMTNTFDRGAIRLDYAYGEYKPNSDIRLIGGKYNGLSKDYLWYTTDMMWDSDINQEGASAHLDFKNVLAGDAFLNAGYWALGESSTQASDLGMYYGQGGMVFDPDPFQIKLAGTFYSFISDDTGSLLLGRASGNTNSGGKYAYDFGKILAGSAEAVYSFPAETASPVKMVGVFGDYVLNLDPKSQNAGYATGIKFGYPKVGVKGDWQMKYQYVSLGADSWLDSLPDSDRYSGNTNIKGHEVILDIGLSKNLSLGLDYYHSQVLKGTALPENVFQADINMKF